MNENNGLSESGSNTKQFSVNWSNHMNHVRSAFDALLTDNELVDVTLYCDGQKTGAHKVLLSACSAYFREVFRDVPSKHPVIILKGVQYRVLQDILKFIYNGEVSIDSDNFDAFIKTAQFLQISGLTDSNNSSSNSVPSESKTQLEGGNPGNSTQNRNGVSSHKQKANLLEDVKVPPLKKFRNNSESDTNMEKVPPLIMYNSTECDSSATMPAGIIKCEPGETSLYTSDSGLDPLTTNSHHEDEDEKNCVSLVAYQSNVVLPPMPVSKNEHVLDSLQDYKDNSQFESIYVPSSELVTSPVRQSAFSESSLKCNICQKVFSHPYSLHHHKAVHSGSTECPICHAVLSRKYNLKIHMKARHNV